MTLSAFAWNIVRTYTLTPGRRYSFGCRYRLGTASILVMYVSAADNDYVGVTGTFLGTPSQGVWSTARLDFSVPPGGIAKLHFGAFGGSIPGLVQQSAGTLDLHSMQIRASAFEGESVSVTDLLADSLALTGSATLDGLTAQGNVGCDQLLCNDVNCTDVFTTGVDASGAVSCAALTATGTVAGAALSSAVSGSSLSILGQQVGVSRPPRIRGTLLKPPGRRLQREGPAEAVPTCEAARPRRDAGHGLQGAGRGHGTLAVGEHQELVVCAPAFAIPRSRVRFSPGPANFSCQLFS